MITFNTKIRSKEYQCAVISKSYTDGEARLKLTLYDLYGNPCNDVLLTLNSLELEQLGEEAFIAVEGEERAMAMDSTQLH